MSDAIDRLEIEVSGGDTKKVEDGLNALAKSLGALQRATTQLGKALDGADFDQFGSGVRKLSKALQPLSNSNRALGRSYGVLGTGISRTTVRFGLLYAGLRRLASRMGDWLNKSNEYVENLHLFRLTMEGATESALEFA